MKQPVQLLLIAAVFAFAGAGLLCSCEKSEHPESPANDKIVAQAVRAAVTNWAITNNWSFANGSEYSNDLIETGAQLIAEGTAIAITNEVATETTSAALILERLDDEGRLPGISKDDHGDFTSVPVEAITTNGDVVTISYPAIRTFRFAKHGGASTNNYRFIKQSKSADWKLQRAWEADSSGQVIQEWPVQ
jgi:hypothetical protein